MVGHLRSDVHPVWYPPTRLLVVIDITVGADVTAAYTPAEDEELLPHDTVASTAFAHCSHILLSYLRFFASRLLGDFDASTKSDGL